MLRNEFWVPKSLIKWILFVIFPGIFVFLQRIIYKSITINSWHLVFEFDPLCGKNFIFEHHVVQFQDCSNSMATLN